MSLHRMNETDRGLRRMWTPRRTVGSALVALVCCVVVETGVGAQPSDESETAIRALVRRLDLEQYKTAIRGLVQFGDRRQGDDAQSRGCGLDRGTPSGGRVYEHRASRLHLRPATASGRASKRRNSSAVEPRRPHAHRRPRGTQRFGTRWQLDIRLSTPHRCCARPVGAAG